jgi:hypothetical protein
MPAVERNLPHGYESRKEETKMKTLRKALFLAACLVVPACASTGANASREEAATVVVDNRALLDHTIYVLRGSQRIRLGVATGLQKTRLTIPNSIVLGATSLRFMADPIGSSRNPISEEINITPGDEIGLTIPPA